MGKYTLYIISLVIIGGIFATLFCDSPFSQEQVEPSNLNNRSLSAHSARDLMIPRSGNQAALLKDDPLARLARGGKNETENYASYLLGLSIDEREENLSEFADDFFGDPDQLFGPVEGVAEVLFKKDPTAAITFLGYFDRNQQIINLERDLLGRWLADDSSSLFTALELNKENFTSLGIDQLRQISSIYSQEMKANFVDWVDFIEGIDGEENGSLKLNAYTSLVEFSSANQRVDIYESLQKEVAGNFQLEHLPGDIIQAQALNDPEEASLWLTNINSKPAKNIALMKFLSAISTPDSVDLGINVLNSDTFFSEYFVPDADLSSDEVSIIQQQEEFFDEALESLLEGVIESDPDFVHSAAEEFYDSEMKEDYIDAALRQKTKLENTN